MESGFKGKTLYFKGVKDFDLDQIFNCGQCFRWDKYEKGYRGFAGRYLCYVYFSGDDLFVEPLTEAENKEDFKSYMTHYLALDFDYRELKEKFSQDPIMEKAMGYAPGIRVLNQPFFETLITFIISQNNNIPRIKKIVDSLSEKYGSDLGGVYAFPTAEQLSDVTEEDFRRLRVGFRAKYLADAMEKIKSGEISREKIKTMDLETAKKYLMKIKGVGPKVADCVLLFSCQKYECVPMDVWMKRAVAEYFPDGWPQCTKGFEGIAQQYIFHYARFNLEAK